jgi:hypothetical protein
MGYYSRVYMGLAKADLARADVKKALKSEHLESFAARRLFDTVPYIFERPPDCTDWKVRAAEMLAVDPCSVFIIGSACSCVSFNPNKNFKVFDEGRESDIDVAVISNYHFEVAWRRFREIGTEYYRLDPAGQAAVKEHRDSHVFWGMFATDKILPVLPFGPKWLSVSVEMSKKAPMEGREIKFRLYRDSYSFVAYHINGLRKLKDQLTAPPPTTR